MLAERFERFDFSVVGATADQLGTYGTAQKLRRAGWGDSSERIQR
jgi:hypothetical protein